MLNNYDLETLSSMVKNQLENLIIKRSKEGKSNPDKTSLDEDIDKLYKLLAKLIILIGKHSSSDLDNYSVQDISQSTVPRELDERSEFIRSLREYWFTLAYAVNSAIHYTFNDNPQQSQYDEVCILLAQSIDNLRSFYTNIKDNPDAHGLYPFEPIKEIYQLFKRLGYEQTDQNTRTSARQQMIDSWSAMREPFLSEFSRSEPKNPVSPYIY